MALVISDTDMTVIVLDNDEAEALAGMLYEADNKTHSELPPDLISLYEAITHP